jgi:hypothetical protein
MARLVPAIHVLAFEKKDVDARDKRRHDDRELSLVTKPPNPTPR